MTELVNRNWKTLITNWIWYSNLVPNRSTLLDIGNSDIVQQKNAVSETSAETSTMKITAPELYICPRGVASSASKISNGLSSKSLLRSTSGSEKLFVHKTHWVRKIGKYIESKNFSKIGKTIFRVVSWLWWMIGDVAEWGKEGRIKKKSRSLDVLDERQPWYREI